jgi:hypothetical protein
MRPFESKGVWWLPDTPTDQVPGVLSYSQADGSRLSLSGSLGRRQGDLPSFPVIHGIVEGGKAATLLESFAVKSSLGGVASTEIFSHFSLRGAHTKALSQQSFQKISIVIDSLAQWAAFTPLSSKLEFVKNRLSRIEVAYAFPKSRVYRGQTATYTVGSGFKTHGDMRHNVEIETLSGIRTPMVRASKGANTGRLDAHGEGLQGGQHGKTRRSRIPAKRRSIEVRVGRLEANRIEEYAAFGARVSAVVIGVLDRHVQDATMRREIRSEIARDILSLNQTDPVEPEKGSGKHVGE